jgi:hypothetical protein
MLLVVAEAEARMSTKDERDSSSSSRVKSAREARLRENHSLCMEGGGAYIHTVEVEMSKKKNKEEWKQRGGRIWGNAGRECKQQHQQQQQKRS